ncbi:MAG: TraB/GumN family protein [Caulobacteraceae bacterium]|nr:TraB/GumN family protein [Caulobacteraceae bacterium]
MKPRALLLSAVLTGLVAAAGPAPAAAPSPAPAAAPSSGPAWWHVTKGNSEVWIIGTPDYLPLQLKWDETALDEHVKGAKSVLVPPGSDQLGGRYQNTHQDPVWKTLDGRLPNAVYRRLYDDIAVASARAVSGGWLPRNPVHVLNALDTQPTYQAGNQLTYGTTLANVTIGNPVASRARSLAARQGIGVDLIKGGATLLPRYLAFVDIPEADQVACVEQQIADFESGAMSRANHVAGISAWVRGDVAHALQRYSYANNCSYGAVGQHFWDEVTAYSVEAVNQALERPGKSVAVLELKPLLMSNGVLDRLTARGARVEGPGVAVNPSLGRILINGA